MEITKQKISQVILELIYLSDQLYRNHQCDHETINQIDKLIESLKFWRQFTK